MCHIEASASEVARLDRTHEGIRVTDLATGDVHEDRARLEERVGQIRHLLETMDLLFDAFGKVRLAETWNKDLSRIRKWLKGNDED